jgi:hypothetical protein
MKEVWIGERTCVVGGCGKYLLRLWASAFIIWISDAYQFQTRKMRSSNVPIRKNNDVWSSNEGGAVGLLPAEGSASIEISTGRVESVQGEGCGPVGGGRIVGSSVSVLSSLDITVIAQFSTYYIVVAQMVSVTVADSSGSDSDDIQEIDAPAAAPNGGGKKGGQKGDKGKSSAEKPGGAAAAPVAVAATVVVAAPADVMDMNPGWQVGQVVEAHSLTSASALNGVVLVVVGRDPTNAPTMTLDRVPVVKNTTHDQYKAAAPGDTQEVRFHKSTCVPPFIPHKHFVQCAERTSSSIL